MTYTEAEAREKVCPFVAHMVIDPALAVMDQESGAVHTIRAAKPVSAHGKCCASGCMAWCWKGPKPQEFVFSVDRFADRSGNYDREGVDREAQKRGFLLPGREVTSGGSLALIYQPDLSKREGFCCIAEKTARES